MAATTVVIGRVAPRSQPAALLVRGVPVQPTRVPIVAGVKECMQTSTVFINDNGRFVRCTGPTYRLSGVCEWCGMEECDCMTDELTPLGLAVREACARLLAGEVKPCRWCGSITPCDCLRWHEYIAMQDADPHGDLSVFSDEDLRY